MVPRFPIFGSVSTRVFCSPRMPDLSCPKMFSSPVLCQGRYRGARTKDGSSTSKARRPVLSTTAPRRQSRNRHAGGGGGQQPDRGGLRYRIAGGVEESDALQVERVGVEAGRGVFAEVVGAAERPPHRQERGIGARSHRKRESVSPLIHIARSSR